MRNGQPSQALNISKPQGSPILHAPKGEQESLPSQSSQMPQTPNDLRDPALSLSQAPQSRVIPY